MRVKLSASIKLSKRSFSHVSFLASVSQQSFSQESLVLSALLQGNIFENWSELKKNPNIYIYIYIFLTFFESRNKNHHEGSIKKKSV